MKELFTIFLITIVCLFDIQAQQELHNTQYYYYKQGYNPAYAGSRETLCASIIYRNQWLGLEGSPESQIMTFSLPLFNQRVGLGFNLSRHAIGITEYLTFEAVYSYRFRLSQGFLGVGLAASLRNHKQDFQDSRLQATQGLTQDPSIPATTDNLLLFNFGPGLYYMSQKFYIGLSSPRILQNNIDFANEDAIISKESTHVFFMTGATIDINKNLQIRPQGILKYADNSPLDFDFNTNLIILNRYLFGLTYRFGGDSTSFGESIDVIAGMQLSPSFLLALSYDITLSQIKDYNSGSIEATIQYCINKNEGKEYVNPRFF